MYASAVVVSVYIHATTVVVCRMFVAHVMFRCVFTVSPDAQFPASICHLVARSFEGWRNLRGRLKYCAVIGVALSPLSSINVQFSI